MPELYTDVLGSAPTVEPVSLFEAKRACDVDDTYRDTEITRWITEARQIVENDARVCLVNTTRVLTLHRFPVGEQLKLPAYSPLSSVTSIAYLDSAGDSQTLSTDVYKVDTARKPPCVWKKQGQSWPTTYDEANAVTITYVAGHGATAADVPAMAKAAMFYMIRHRLDNPDIVTEARLMAVDETYTALILRLQTGDYP